MMGSGAGKFDNLPLMFSLEVAHAVKGEHQLNSNEIMFWCMINSPTHKAKFLKFLQDGPNYNQAIAVVKEYVARMCDILIASSSKFDMHQKTVDLIGIPLSLSSIATGITAFAKSGTVIAVAGPVAVASGGTVPVAVILVGATALLIVGGIRTMLGGNAINDNYRARTFARFGKELGAVA